MSLILVIGFLKAYGQTDVKNSKDYYLLDRMPNYHIISYNETAFDAHSFFIENKKTPIEGKKFSIKYQHGKSDDKNFEFPTRLQILRNYSNAIKKAGGEIVSERYNSEWGHYTFKTTNAKEIWVEVKTSISAKTYTVTVIERQTMKQEIAINAELIKNKIELEGKIAIYGIYFDVGKSIIKKESESALLQISEYLRRNKAINCWVVGHTDSDGSFELNSKLSLERAKAIKKHLQEKYGIASNRLFAEGVGPLAPVASNNTEEGKKLNRRVELVKKQ
ncbi:OmpA family protein [uncultured Croceitalea sp.]|uniref:OmpA family protein n=1 Tax=uncultured Croceitalea sp. TaxID=1798908 RepID=UPI003305711C